MWSPRFLRNLTKMGWQWKVFIPLIAVLVASLVGIAAVMRQLQLPNSQAVVMVVIGFAILMCFELLIVLLVLVEEPLRELKSMMTRIQKDDLSARVTFSKRVDDIGQLGRQFNNMVSQLERNRAEIADLHRREMARAEHLATVGELAAGLAHEIRNPLAGIAGVVDVMGRELPANSASREVMGDVQREIKHIQAILNDLLSYSRPRPPEFHPADLNTTVEQAILLARQQFRTKPVQVVFEANRELPMVVHDPGLIQQVTLNLLLNGIQAIPKEGTVTLELSREGEMAGIRIADTGKGISAESLPKIFKPFFTTRSEGTGLGLSLAKSIVESHGGRVEVSSVPGRGTEFRVWLPIDHPVKKQDPRSDKV